jgi:hypothetical protein
VTPGCLEIRQRLSVFFGHNCALQTDKQRDANWSLLPRCVPQEIESRQVV